MKPNRFKQAIAARGSAVGTMLMEFGTRGIARILASSEADFVVLDMEHSSFDAAQIGNLCAWFKATDIAPFVRVPQDLYHFCARTLDAGALGIMVANVETAAQAKAIVDACKYAPMGKRGIALGTRPQRLPGAQPAGVLPACQREHHGHHDDRIAGGSAERRCHRRHARRGCSVGGALRSVERHGHPRRIPAPRLPGRARLCRLLPRGGPARSRRFSPPTWTRHGSGAISGFDVLSYSLDIAIYRQAVSAGIASLNSLIAEKQPV